MTLPIPQILIQMHLKRMLIKLWTLNLRLSRKLKKRLKRIKMSNLMILVLRSLILLKRLNVYVATTNITLLNPKLGCSTMEVMEIVSLGSYGTHSLAIPLDN